MTIWGGVYVFGGDVLLCVLFQLIGTLSSSSAIKVLCFIYMYVCMAHIYIEAKRGCHPWNLHNVDAGN